MASLDVSPSLTVTHEKASVFYDRFERKGELQHQTHYCPGCGHGITHKLLAQALDDMGLQDRTVLVSPVPSNASTITSARASSDAA